MSAGMDHVKARLVMHTVDYTQRVDEIVTVRRRMAHGELERLALSRMPGVQRLMDRTDAECVVYRLEPV